MDLGDKVGPAPRVVGQGRARCDVRRIGKPSFDACSGLDRHLESELEEA
jgi:hypothetical protein